MDIKHDKNDEVSLDKIQVVSVPTIAMVSGLSIQIARFE